MRPTPPPDTAPVTAESTVEPTPGAVRRLRIAALCAVLTGLAFLQAPGLTVADSKTDLTVDPLGWLQRALHVWYPDGTFGQLQNQAYGYFWPMGPFFVAGDLAGVPVWAVQRLWWALLMCLAATGVVLLAERLRIGTPASRLLAGAAFALSPRLLTELGPISVEAWPSAVAPWVLVPLAALGAGGSVRRAVTLSALAVACAGGANATAVLAVVPLAVLLIATRPGLRRRWLLLAAWCGAVAAATAWWVVPLLLLGRYSPPFLDYVETAEVTTRITDLVTVLRGASHWLGFYNEVHGPAWPAGWRIANETTLVAATIVVAALGVAGLASRAMPHRRFLVTGLLVGLALVGVGHVGEVDGLLAGLQRQFLDGAGAPLRNVHKFDVVLRLPLILGMAHLLGVLQRAAAAAGPGWHGPRKRAATVGVAALAAVAVAATPALAGGLAARGAYAEVPGYWREASSWLDDNLGRDHVLVVPAARFPRYTWGSPTDEITQSLVRGGWGVRGAIPLTPPTTIRLLDAVESVIANGAGSPGLADLLARSGVRYLLVRSDLNYGSSGAARPLTVRQALDRSPGLRQVAGFGPIVGNNKILGGYIDEGMDVPVRALEVFRVERPVDRVVAYDAEAVTTVVGGPESLLELAAAGRLPAAPTVLAGDLRGAAPPGPVAVTDGMRRREVAFGLPYDAASATMDADDEPHLDAPSPDFLPDWGADQATVVRYVGIRSVTAASSWSQANPLVGARPAHHPFAALDGDPGTSWQSAPGSVPDRQWLQVELSRPRAVTRVRVRFDTGADMRPTQITVQAGPERETALVVEGVAEVRLPGRYATGRVRVSVDRADALGYRFGTVGVSELEIDGVRAGRTLVPPPAPATTRPPTVVVAAAPAVPSCFFLDDQPRCADGISRASEDADRLDRTVALPTGGAYTADVWVRPRLGAALGTLIDAHTGATDPDRGGATVTASSVRLPDPAARPAAVLDGDPATAWLPANTDPSPWVRVAWPTRRTITAVRVSSHPEVAAARPTRVQVLGDGGARTGTVDQDGLVRFDRPLVTDDITVLFPAGTPASSYDPYANRFEPLPIGVGELTVLPGRVNPALQPEQRLSVPCGQGPTVTVGKTRLTTAVDVSLRDLVQLREVRARVCGTAPVRLGAGEARLVAAPGAAFTPVRLALTPAADPSAGTAGSASATTDRSPVRVERWEETNRRVHLAELPRPRVLVMRDNHNPGWEATVAGRRLEPVVVDGWQQGFVVPAGLGGDVELSFAADLPYGMGLLVGAGLLLLVLVIAVRPVRRRGPDRPAGPAGRGGWLLPAVVGGAALLVVGGGAAVALALGGLALVTAGRLLPPHLSGTDRRRLRWVSLVLAWALPVGCLALAGWHSMAGADRHQAALPQLAALAAVTALWLSVAVPPAGRGQRAPQR